MRGFERKQKLTHSQQMDFSIETQLLRTSACIKYGVWVTECGEWICGCGADAGQNYKGFVLPSAVVILIHEEFPCFVRIR